VFTQLYRMGKRARFVRYWGEAHNCGSPASIRHLWNEVGAWFDAPPARRARPVTGAKSLTFELIC
jgi:dipeptidyl aminopeptidase/acylaminoacyl peptidase